ncbi:response regulator [uncultured Thermanaerothrix sp.]|uniref:response regulator n=1 Tax=uncultured Thermanaerothrix sp. TaxID=1195149 RepID=UPI002626CBBE|nr:response regulator [uncultured Thermanaerothrix sp.]
MANTEKITVAIVDDILETRETIRRALQLEPNIEVVGVARNGQEAIELVFESRPDVVIMDINMPDMDGITATEAIRRKVPYTQVVILSVQNDPGYMRRAMLAGARDFLSKPPDIDELLAAVRRAGAMALEEKRSTSILVENVAPSGTPSPAQKGKIIAVYGPKGGTGKTLLATNLAIALQVQNQRTILVDGDLQFGDVAVILNERGKNSVIDLAIRAEELDAEVVEGVVVAHRETKLSILVAPPTPEMALQVSGEQFAKFLQFLSTLYRFVIVDTSSYLSDTTQSTLETADLIVLITTQELPTLKNVSLFLTLADKSNIPRDRLILVLNRYDKRINLDAERIYNSLKHPIEVVIPLDERAAIQSILKGRPFVLEDRSSAITKGVLNLAELIQQKISQLEAPPERETVGKKRGV